jgi:thiosulfate/3-mercaptopyruvate sulfurtransferase
MYKTLIDCHTLALHIHDPQWVVVDCRFALSDPGAGRRAYDAGHIDRARYAHLNEDLSSPITSQSGRHPLPDPQRLAAKLGEWGIDNSKQVIAYDDSFGAMASRLWWLLRWLGHDSVALLDGGLPRWTREGRPVTKELPVVTTALFTPQPRDNMWVDANTVAKAVKQDDWLVMDARAEERFNGEVEMIDPVAGHIPGAINLPFDDNLHLSGRFSSEQELRELYEGLIEDVHPEQVIQMCGSGVTACHNILAMEHAGMPGAKLYAGSWSEWIRDSARPVAHDD